MTPKICHLLLGSVLLFQLDGCAHSSKSPPPAATTTGKQDLLALYSRADVPEVPLEISTDKPAGPRAGDGGSRLSSLLHREAASLRACYRLSRRRGGAELEPVRLDIELETAHRRVQSVQITGTRNGRLERCLIRNIKRWRLPARLPRTVSLPLVFQSS
jgi:hypothetical protein